MSRQRIAASRALEILQNLFSDCSENKALTAKSTQLQMQH